MNKHMFIKNSQAMNNRYAMKIDQTTLKWGANNVNHGNVYLNLANFSFNDFYRRLSTNFVRNAISDGWIDSAIAFTALLRIILLVNFLPPSLTFLLKSARGFRWDVLRD